MKKLFTLLLGLICSIYSFGQWQMVAFTDFTNEAAIGYSTFDGTDLFDTNDVEGTLYLEEDFIKAYIIDAILKNKSNTYLRYDAYNDFFEIQFDPYDSSFKRLKRTPRFQYVLNGEKFVLLESKVLDIEHYNSGNGYAVELTTPAAKAVLYKRYYKKFNPGSVSTSSYRPDVRPSLNTNSFYILKLGDEFIKAETHKKRILDAFPADRHSAIEEFIKYKKFNFRGTDAEIEEEMIQIVRYYNTL